MTLPSTLQSCQPLQLGLQHFAPSGLGSRRPMGLTSPCTPIFRLLPIRGAFGAPLRARHNHIRNRHLRPVETHQVGNSAAFCLRWAERTASRQMVCQVSVCIREHGEPVVPQTCHTLRKWWLVRKRSGFDGHTGEHEAEARSDLEEGCTWGPTGRAWTQAEAPSAGAACSIETRTGIGIASFAVGLCDRRTRHSLNAGLAITSVSPPSVRSAGVPSEHVESFDVEEGITFIGASAAIVPSSLPAYRRCSRFHSPQLPRSRWDEQRLVLSFEQFGHGTRVYSNNSPPLVIP